MHIVVFSRFSMEVVMSEPNCVSRVPEGSELWLKADLFQVALLETSPNSE